MASSNGSLAPPEDATLNTPTRSFSTLSWSEALALLHDDWAELIRSTNTNPTMLPGWLDIVLKASTNNCPVYVMTMTSQGKLEAVIPYFFSESKHFGLSFRVLKLLTNFVSYHAAIPTSAPQDQVVSELLNRAGTWHLFHAANLVDNGAAGRSVTSLARRERFNLQSYPVETSPYLPITSSWDDYLTSRNKKFRYKLRQREKTLRKTGPLSLISHRSASDVSGLIRDIVAIDNKSWKAKYHLDIGSRRHETQYYSALLPYLATLDALHADVLYYGELPIAYSLCCHWNSWFGQLKTSFDEEFSHLSPGSIVIDSSIKAAFDQKATEFDFLGDTDHHKRAWTEHARKHNDYFVYSRSNRSRALYALKQAKRTLISTDRVKTVKPKSAAVS